MLCEIWYTCQDRLIISYGERMPYLLYIHDFAITVAFASAP
jgi:hypothetical protein